VSANDLQVLFLHVSKNAAYVAICMRINANDWSHFAVILAPAVYMFDIWM